ncbi:rho guanine nucleotide exchange factor 7-like [Centruroides vittatus]|uniref:rho guanine nucleotide exchange factor 7-like n=1 Tax=Centruroides vittatus TaxID=120091 RepID=UPI00350F6BD5
MTLCGNLEEILECHKMFLTALEEVEQRPSREQKIGGVFMQFAPQIKKVHLLYCSNHPKAASVIEKHRETLNKFMEDKGATSPGILVLTTGLSRPFRRIEKYPALLQELQRYTEVN